MTGRVVPMSREMLCAGLIVLAGCTTTTGATVQLGNTVLCGPTAVIMPSQAVTSLIAMLGPEAYGTAVCQSVAGVDAAGLTQPTAMRVILPTGETTVRVMQNLR